MANATLSSSQKFLILGGLYAAQGLPYGFFVQALPAILREQQLSLTAIGAASVLAAPWGLKVLWAPLVERFLPLRSWILGLQLASLLGLVAISFLEPSSQLVWLSLAVFCTNLTAATQDIGTDGLAVGSLSADERGWANGLQVAAYRVGMLLGGGVLLAAYESLGWQATLLTMAGGLAVFSLPLALTPAYDQPPAPESAPRGWDWLKLPGAVQWMGLLFAFKFGDYLVGTMVKPWLVDVGLSLTEQGVIMGGGGVIAGLLGAMVGGGVTSQLPRRTALWVFGLAQAAGLASYALVAALGAPHAGIWTAVLLEHFLGGCATAALFTAMMDASREERGATDYTLQASVVVVGSLAGATVSGVIADQLGYVGTFTLGTILAFAGPLLVKIPAMTRRLPAQRDGTY